MALRYDSMGLDDVVVEAPTMFRAEMMSKKDLWMCCYFGNDERVTFSVRSSRGHLLFDVTEEPSVWFDRDSRRGAVDAD